MSGDFKKKLNYKNKAHLYNAHEPVLRKTKFDINA